MDRHEIDMINGPITGRVIRFSVPLMLSSMLQLLFNAADVVVVSNFCGSTSMAAVGSNGSVINLLVNLFIGISVGTNVLVARSWGRQHADSIFRAVHTAVLLSILLGVFIGIFGSLASHMILELMSVPEDVLPLASLYLRIYFLGMPATVVYNFCAAVLRAIGDTKRPLAFLSVAGVVNVVCNLFFVIVCHMDVAGVAIASALSQYVAAFLVLRCLTRLENACRLSFKMLHIHAAELKEMLRIGIPSGLTGTIFSLSNVVIQSSINSFGSDVIAGNVAGSNLSDFIYVAMNSFQQAAVSFTSQNVGASRAERLPKIAKSCIFCAAGVGVAMSLLFILFGKPLLSIYNREPHVIAVGMIRMRWIVAPYFLCGIMDAACGVVRGLGHAWLPMIISLLGSCGLRIVWIYTVFAANHTLPMLYVSYPISWAVTFLGHLVCAVVLIRRFARACGITPTASQMPPLSQP